MTRDNSGAMPRIDAMIHVYDDDGQVIASGGLFCAALLRHDRIWDPIRKDPHPLMAGRPLLA
jgi:hypothetical protein